MYDAFFDELVKIAASRKRMTVPQSRKGRRPMRVDTMLRKEKDGSLYKKAGKYGKNSAGFDLQGKTDVRGIPVAIENRKGSVRKGENDDGTKWRTKYKLPYGYIEGTKGADGEEVDAYVGPDRDANEVYVVHQKDDKGKYDEDTAMLGFRSKAKAKKAIHDHYDDPKYVGKITAVGFDKFREIVTAPNKKKLTKISQVQAAAVADSLLSYVPKNELVAKKKRKSGDVPDAHGSPGNVPTESTQTVRKSTALAPSNSMTNSDPIAY